ncbi:hypothetical protein [Ekhidna sp.]
MSKTAKYSIAIAVLLAANLWLFLGSSSSYQKTVERYFDSSDLEGVSGFEFVFGTDTVRITLTGEGWIVNDTYKADQNFVNTLISVLERVEVGGVIENWDSNVLGKVEVEFDFNSRYRFDFASNPNKTRSYFITENGAREVSVPGYRDNVVDIFMLHPDQWRDRLVFDGSWRTIQKLKVENSKDDDFEISFVDKFFLVNGEQPSDSSAVVDYLNQFQQFQANEMISPGRFEELDSISSTEPFAIVTINDIKSDDPIRLEVFASKPGQSYHLVKDQDGQGMVIGAGRVRQILSNPERLN